MWGEAVGNPCRGGGAVDWGVSICADDRPEGLCITGDGAVVAAPAPTPISAADDAGDSGTPSIRRRFRGCCCSEVIRGPGALVGVAGATNIKGGTG